MKPWSWLIPKLKSQEPSPAHHITWAKASAGRTISRTVMRLKRQTWIFPILAIALLVSIGMTVRGALRTTMNSNVRTALQTLLTVETEMLLTWFKVQESIAESQANDLRFREMVYQLLEETDATAAKPVALKESTVHTKLKKNLSSVMAAHDYVGYIVADKSNRIISSSSEELIGMTDVPEYDGFLKKAFDGSTTVSPPFLSTVTLRDEHDRTRTGVPTMFVCAPIRDASFQVVAALGLRIRPEDEFTRLLRLGQMGKTGETYAFDRSARMISKSRFDDALILLGLLPDDPYATSLLNISLRDPQVNMEEGLRPKIRRSELPLTYMAANCIGGPPGFNVDGYRDYRGVPVVGAWKWLPDYDMGVATEVDRQEAFQSLRILQWTFWGLIGLLAVSSVAIFIYSMIAAQLRMQAQKAVLETQKLGQYTLEKKLGSGAMGVVYKGVHAILRRPTAIKMLNIEKVNEASIERFEREVQITCQLNHPNTVAVYDYGRTPEGVFYYAMEFLDGIDLQALVDRYGPQPESRVIRILTQLCGSLYEAHSLGLVHRDIKPANLMLNRRGGEPDVIKVLDFGLVKAMDEKLQSNLTANGALTGTPMYMSPEAIQTPNLVDSRTDLYAVGAVGYFLLTGSPVFDADSIVELCRQHVAEMPQLPSQRLGKPISDQLEGVLLACLEKQPSKRPQTAREIALMLEKCPAATQWSIEAADAWWGRHERGDSVSLGDSARKTGKPSTASEFAHTFITNVD